jgi:hypothetical protein
VDTSPENTPENNRPRPLYERFLRFLVLGALSLIWLYVKALGGILKMGIKAIRNIPMDGKK